MLRQHSWIKSLSIDNYEMPLQILDQERLDMLGSHALKSMGLDMVEQDRGDGNSRGDEVSPFILLAAVVTGLHRSGNDMGKAGKGRCELELVNRNIMVELTD